MPGKLRDYFKRVILQKAPVKPISFLEFSPIENLDETVRTTSPPWRPQYQLSMRKYALNQCSAISVRLVSISP